MKFIKPHNKSFIYAIIFTAVIALTVAVIYSSLAKWQNSLVERNKLICELYTERLYDASAEAFSDLGSRGLLINLDLSSSERKLIDTTLKKISEEQLKVQEGLEGGFYLLVADEFYGYSFPTSPPPVPVYGPPPRSYNIIKYQALKSIEENRSVVDLHSFDAAVFPLATKPIRYNSDIIGVTWVRIHIENDLPVIKLKQIVNATAIISLLGFIVLMLVSSLLGGEVQGIKKEMEGIRHNPALRLRKRWGIFGYIAASINDMLNTIEEENSQRQVLEKELHQKEKLASLGNMIAGVAHEVKTPLAIIKTRIQMWQQEVNKNTEIAEHISPGSMQMVIDETNRLSTLVKRLLIFSRPIDNKIKPADINKLIGEVVSFIDIEKKNQGISVRYDHDSDIPYIRLDENAIKQVLINVLENSIEAMPDGGSIFISAGLVPGKSKMKIEISDTGKGIPDEIFNKIFDPFFTSKESGVGLGLSISYEIIKAHHGEIFFSNNSGKGTKCTIELPL
jgi:signal transduction histidine kinase